MKKSSGILLIAMASLSMSAAAQSVLEYTYSTEDHLYVIGNKKSKEYYDIAIKIDDPALLGAKITGLRVPVVDSEEVSGYSMWLSSELTLEKNEEGKKVANPDICIKQGERDDKSLSVTFDEPYEITGPVYAGYSFYVENADNVSGFPVVVTAEVTENGLWMHSTKTYLNWKNQSETIGVTSNLTAILDGDFSPNAAAVYSAKGVKVEAGKEAAYKFQIVNHGTGPINNLSYTFTYGDKNGSGTVEFEEPLSRLYTKVYDVTVTLPAQEEIGAKELSLVIDKVNGEPNDDSANSLSVIINTLDVVPVHRALMEEFTGLWCGYCVRGYAGMEYLWENHSDICVPVVYHNGDPMAIEFPVDIPGLPSGMVDRVASVDPSYGPGNTAMLDLVTERSDIETEVAVDIVPQAPQEDGTIDFQAQITWVVQPEDLSDYSVQWVLMSDNLSDETWGQTNYYSGSTNVDGWPGMEQFVDGGNKVFGLVFNNVAVLNNGKVGEYGLIDEVVVNEPATIDFSLNYNDAISEHNNQLIVQNPDDLKVAVIVFKKDSKGNVEALNANVAKLGKTSGTLRLEGMEKEVRSIEYYGVDGQSLVNPEGLVVRMTRYTDGSTKAEKVVIKK